MEKIDRLGWAAGIAVQVYGLKIGFRVRDPLILESLLARVPAGWTLLNSGVVDRLYSVVTPTVPPNNVRHLCVLYGDDAILTRTERLRDLLEEFESDLDFYIASNSQEPVFVHGGAVKWKQHAILLPGSSQSGKSSLVAEFLRAGASLYGDDLAIIDRSGFLHSYPRALCLRSEGDLRRKVWRYELGAACAEPSPVSTVLFTQYAKDSCWHPQPISRGEGLLRMLQNTPSARRQPGLVMDVLGNAIRNAEIHVGSRGEKEETVERVLNYLDRRSL